MDASLPPSLNQARKAIGTAQFGWLGHGSPITPTRFLKCLQLNVGLCGKKSARHEELGWGLCLMFRGMCRAYVFRGCVSWYVSDSK